MSLQLFWFRRRRKIQQGAEGGLREKTLIKELKGADPDYPYDRVWKKINGGVQ